MAEHTENGCYTGRYSYYSSIQLVHILTGTPTEFEYKLHENEKLNVTLSEYQSPITIHSTIENDGYGKSILFRPLY